MTNSIYQHRAGVQSENAADNWNSWRNRTAGARWPALATVGKRENSGKYGELCPLAVRPKIDSRCLPVVLCRYLLPTASTLLHNGEPGSI